MDMGVLALACDKNFIGVSCYYGLMVSYVICVGGVFLLLNIVSLGYKMYLLIYRAQCLCRIFTNLAESFLYHVIHQPGTPLGDMAIMNMLIQCVKHPDYEVCLCVCFTVPVCMCMCRYNIVQAFRILRFLTSHLVTLCCIRRQQFY